MNNGGSSPRARGARDPGPLARDYLGIIPACAGSTGRPWLDRFRCRDHPRVRGEHGDEVGEGVGPGGSSPRARGAPCPPPRGHTTAGIIPACAGSTLPVRPTTPGSWDHPRVRGEHSVNREEGMPDRGSSPRARGAPSRRIRSFQPGGIIPACAGSTANRKRRSRTFGDHPRVRGEHIRRSSCTITS